MPNIGILFVDYTIAIWLGRYGFSVGPWFLSLDRDGDALRFYGRGSSSLQCETTWQWSTR